MFSFAPASDLPSLAQINSKVRPNTKSPHLPYLTLPYLIYLNNYLTLPKVPT